LFPHDRDLAYQWMTAPNRRLGARPVDLIVERGFEGLLALRRYQRTATPAALVTRTFDYGTVISYSFDSSHWQQSRFSDARRYGVWYVSIDLETAVYETARHR
jgi:hypothetical protein